MELRSATKRAQDDAYKKGKERAEGYKKGKGGSPKDDDYGNMTDEEKDAYKEGYRAGQ